MWVLWTVGACEQAGPDAADRVVADPNPREPALERLARAAPAAELRWEGAWTVAVVAPEPAGAGALALAAGVGVAVSTWETLPRARRGLVVAAWLPAGSDAAETERRLAGFGGGAAVVAILGPGDSAWAQAASTSIPWAGAGVIDAAASASLWTDPVTLDDAMAGTISARVLADHYRLPFVPVVRTVPPLPPGLDVYVGPLDPDRLHAADVRTRAAAARLGGGDELAQDREVAVRLSVAATSVDVAVLGRLAGDPEPLVRTRVAERSEDVRLLAVLCQDGSSVVRAVATHRLAHLPGGGADDEVRAQALRAAAASHDAYQRWKAAYGLRDVETLARLLRDPDVDVRREAARTLGRLGDPAGTQPLLSALQDPNSFVRRWAAEALGRNGDRAAIPGLRAAADDPTGLVAQAAVRSLSQLGMSAPVKSWRPNRKPASDSEIALRIASADATERKDVAKFLSGRADAQALAWFSVLAGDEDSEVRKCAIDAMAASRSALAMLRAAVADADPDVRVTAFDALRRNTGGTVEILAPWVTDPDAEIRLRAVEALATLGPSEALRAAAANPDERVRAAVLAVYPEFLLPSEPSIIVRRAAATGHNLHDGDSLLADSGALGYWARGILSREDDLLHFILCWNELGDRPVVYEALRPPTIRAYGHPDRG